MAKEIRCPVREKCGGCKYQGVLYEEQLKEKEKTVGRLMGKYCTIYPIKGMKEPYHYRNKVHAVFDRDKKGRIISGIYQEGSHRVVHVEKCLIEDELSDEIIGTIRELAKSFKLKIYDEDTGYGLLRHVLIRRGFTTGEVMVIIVTASPVFPSRNNFVKALRDAHPEITTIVHNINERHTSMVLGDKNKVLYGKGYITDVLCKKTFRISAGSFYQINPVQTEVLYRRAVTEARLTGKETVIDAYCGTGTIGITAAEHAKRVLGIELNKKAVIDAFGNAKANNVKNIDFICDDAGRFMTKLASRLSEPGQEKPDVLFMDPPRSGSSESFLRSAVTLGVERIVYVSCNPVTLERDVRFLTKHGYTAKGVWPVDMFPHTDSIECVCLLEKGSAPNKRKGMGKSEQQKKNAEQKERADKKKTYFRKKKA